MPALTDKQQIAALLALRHPERDRHITHWKFLLDSLEGGDRYRYAVYGYEPYRVRAPRTNVATGAVLKNPDDGSPLFYTKHWNLPRRNLIRHRREYPTPERPEAGQAEFTSTDDEFELRLARTPVPGFVGESMGIHLGQIYQREIDRDGPDILIEWWKDVDGRGTSMDDWMRETIAPLLSVLGQLDLIFDHPKVPDGEEVRTRADQRRLNLDRCVAGFILPINLLWWRLDPSGKRYEECLVAEGWREAGAWNTQTLPDHPLFLRHWTAEDSVLYDADGEVVSVTPHAFGRVPIDRVFDTRKPQAEHTGQSRYGPVAEIQREYYNLDSEDVLANTLQAHPLLSGPEDYCQGDAITIGPGYVLPMRKTASGGYAGWGFVSPPNDSADKRRQKLMDLRDRADRATCLAKPAGMTAGGTVSQSGISKMMDAATGHSWLASQSKMLRRCEQIMAEEALNVLTDGAATETDVASIDVDYPVEFDLRTPEDLTNQLLGFQKALADAGRLPEVEGAFLSTLVRLGLPGLDDDRYTAFDEEIKAHLATVSGPGRAAPMADALGRLTTGGLPLPDALRAVGMDDAKVAAVLASRDAEATAKRKADGLAQRGFFGGKAKVVAGGGNGAVA